MGDGTSDDIQVELQIWSANSSGGQVHSADSPVLGRRPRTCMLEIVLPGYPSGPVACRVHVSGLC